MLQIRLPCGVAKSLQNSCTDDRAEAVVQLAVAHYQVRGAKGNRLGLGHHNAFAHRGATLSISPSCYPHTLCRQREPWSAVLLFQLPLLL
jgi:hypothetical protein